MLSSNVRLFAISAFILATATFSANGQVVVEDTNITFSPSVSPGGVASGSLQTTATIVQNIFTGDTTSLDFESTVLATPSIPPVLSAFLTGGAATFDEGSDWYVGTAGALFSLNTIASGNFAPLSVTQSLSSGGAVQSFSPSIPPVGDFFLAVATSSATIGPPVLTTNEAGEVFFARDVFGWARLSLNQDGGVTLLDNAVAYGTGNIIVGENAFAVPEPSAAALLAFCGLGFLRRSRQSRLAI